MNTARLAGNPMGGIATEKTPERGPAPPGVGAEVHAPARRHSASEPSFQAVPPSVPTESDVRQNARIDKIEAAASKRLDGHDADIREIRLLLEPLQDVPHHLSDVRTFLFRQAPTLPEAAAAKAVAIERDSKKDRTRDAVGALIAIGVLAQWILTAIKAAMH